MTAFRAQNNMGVDNLFRLSIFSFLSILKLTQAEHADEVAHVSHAFPHSSLDEEKSVFRFDAIAQHLLFQAVMQGVVSLSLFF